MKIFPLVIILLLSVSSSSAQTPDSLPRSQQSAPVETLTSVEIAALINECGERMTEIIPRIFNYTYTERVIEYEVDRRSGQVRRERSKIYETTPVRLGRRGVWVRVQVGEDGVPFTAERIERERVRVIRRFAEVEAEASQARSGQANSNSQSNTQPRSRFSSFGITVEQRTHGGMGRNNWGVSPTQFFLSHEFYAPRRRVLNGRETILLSFRPRPNFVYDAINFPFQEGIESYARVMAQLGGNVWIDAADKIIIRLEAIPLQELSGAASSSSDAPSQNAPIGFELVRLPSGVWVPSRSWYNSHGRENLFWRTAISRERRYTDFRPFATSIEGERLDAPPPQTQPL